MSQTSDHRARDLFEAAKLDGPSASARNAMWAGIQSTTAGASSLAAMKGAGLVSSKLAIGIALGATLTVGIAATVIALTRTTGPARPSERITAVAAPHALERPVVTAKEVVPPVVITGHVQGQTPPASVELDSPSPVHAAATTTATPAATLSEQDRLAREARLVSEARGALHRGDPEAALRIVRAARAQRGARMVPEEMTVEAQALRAMGDDVGAQSVEAELAGKYPEQALGH